MSRSLIRNQPWPRTPPCSGTKGECSSWAPSSAGICWTTLISIFCNSGDSFDDMVALLEDFFINVSIFKFGCCAVLVGQKPKRGPESGAFNPRLSHWIDLLHILNKADWRGGAPHSTVRNPNKFTEKSLIFCQEIKIVSVRNPKTIECFSFFHNWIFGQICSSYVVFSWKNTFLVIVKHRHRQNVTSHHSLSLLWQFWLL